MMRYAAFLRAINVGGHTVKMDRLRTLLEEFGFANVTTFIASGNVIFEAAEDDAAALEARTEAALHEALQYPVGVFLRTLPEVQAVADFEPFPAQQLAVDGSSLYISFLKEPPSGETVARVLALRSETDDFRVDGRELYWYCRGKLSESPLFPRNLLERALKMTGTQRNITTVRKIAAKYGGA